MYLALAILMLAAIACGSPEPVEPTPTPDVPSFAKGEARALVKAKIIDLIHGSHPTYCGEGMVQGRSNFIYSTSTSESYLGQQTWSVKSDPFRWDSGIITATSTLEWKVYEFSGVVDPTNTVTLAAMVC